MKYLNNLLLLLLLASLAACTGKSTNQKKSAQDNPDQPNIVFILVDDLSYGDIGCYGQEKIKTPNIDLLATEGIKFTQAYAGNAVCAPARSTLMQGLHPGHARVRDNMINGFRETLREGDYTVAMLLKEAGYKTGLFGKWGLANHDQYGIPPVMGFDESYGYLNQRHAHCHYPEFLYHNGERVYYPENGTHHLPENYKEDQPYDENGICHPLGIEDHTKAKYAFDEYCEKSLEFVRNNSEDPFFLYLAYTPPHGSYIAPDLNIYKDLDWPLSHKIYASMVTRVDDEVGKLLNLLKELKIDNNTLVIFASDNGNTGGNAKEDETPNEIFFNSFSPTRGGKGDIYDGAFNVPAMARWPGVIEAGTVSDHIWAFWDFLPTAADLAGVETPGNTDGISFLPTLLGQIEEQKEHEFLYWEYKAEQAVRMGKWYGFKNKKGKLEIYDLENNPEQDTDLSEKYPEIYSKIDEIMQSEHTPSDVFLLPGESNDEYKIRMKSLGVTEENRPDNAGNF